MQEILIFHLMPNTVFDYATEYLCLLAAMAAIPGPLYLVTYLHVEVAHVSGTLEMWEFVIFPPVTIQTPANAMAPFQKHPPNSISVKTGVES